MGRVRYRDSHLDGWPYEEKNKNQSVGQVSSKGGRRPQALAGIMTIREVAAYLHCHTSTVYRFVKRGSIPAFKLGSDWRFMRSEIELWISKQSLRTRLRADRKSSRKPGGQQSHG
jgi:excisionase family DNA binding protein